MNRTLTTGNVCPKRGEMAHVDDKLGLAARQRCNGLCNDNKVYAAPKHHTRDEEEMEMGQAKTAIPKAERRQQMIRKRCGDIPVGWAAD